MKCAGWLAFGLGLVLAVGCQAGARRASWWIELPPALAERAVEIEATIRQGGCQSTTLVFSDRFSSAARGATPPVLDPGTYGFAARARDADCVWFASGCTNVTLPASAEAITRLAASSELREPGCEQGSDGGAADAGPLDRGDAGESDAGESDAGESDAGPPDAGALDAGADAAPDAGPPSCTDRFGTAAGFQLCEQTAGGCRFFVSTAGASCADLCGSFGAACMGAEDDDSAGPICSATGPIDCTAGRGDSICTCSR